MHEMCVSCNLQFVVILRVFLMDQILNGAGPVLNVLNLINLHSR